MLTKRRTRVEARIGVIRANEPRIAFALTNPVTDKLPGFVATNLDTPGLAMVGPDACKGQTLALCGAGPSLAAEKIRGVNQVWACNSALPYLVKEGRPVHVGIGIDQTPGLLREWLEPPDVTYYVATSCDPALVAHLRSHNRKVLFFHNAVGFPGEWEVYDREYPPGFMVGEGATVVSRVIGLAQWQGFERVDIYGADCAFGPADKAHANGEDAKAAYGNSMLLEGEVNGRKWRTRADMLMGAVDLARRAQKAQGRIRLVGDTLPVALLGKDDAFLDHVMRRLEPGELPGDANG